MDFVSWYKARHDGKSPFPWQQNLAERVARGDWPDALTPPTGAGKTTVIGVWLWAIERGLDVPRRLVFVVDRRLIVDSTAEYAQRLAQNSPAKVPVIAMRGGLAIDESWIDPLRPAILISTVDQAGSRLLFSGYGVSERSAPIHAALLGNDALWVLDEVHLAQPLLKTLQQVQHLRGNAVPAPLRVLVMSATWESTNSLGLTDADWRHPVLRPRLTHPKPIVVQEIDPDADLRKALVDEARRLRKQGAEVVGIVANRVRDARAVFERLRRTDDAVLLTGRVRPVDRDRLLEAYLPRMRAGSRGDRSPLYVVATQTIEVGADLDFDGLVSESAPFSALRQRAGRLNRLGELASAPMVVIHQPPPKRQRGNGAKRADAGQAALDRKLATEAVRWLKKHKIKDFSIAALAAKPMPAEPAPGAPELLPAHLDLLSWTSARPGIDVAPWLHGWPKPERSVFLCWRCDAAPDTAQLMPPIQQELLEVPRHELARLPAAIALRWDGSAAEPIALNDAQHGDTLILDAAAGGCDAFGWNPATRDLVTDHGDNERRVRVQGDEDADWHALARAAGMRQPGRVLPYPNGALVLAASEWTSAAAIRPVLLRDHQRAVGERARALAERAGLAGALVDAVAQAGAGHDTGKLDPRWLARIGADPSKPLAKGPRGDDPLDLLPRGWRHEMLSAARVPPDRPLVRHLIGSHHGHGRPSFPCAPDPALWRQLQGWAAQFESLQAQYGWWGLAYLEALVRLADWQISDEEQRDDHGADRAAA